MVRFDPNNWYWLASDGRLYSSAVEGLIDAGSSDYQAWLASGKFATLWPRDDAGNQTVAALQAVLTRYGLFVDLVAYANAAQWAKATGGYVATIDGQQVTFKTDSDGRDLMTSKAARLQQPNPPAIVQWQAGPTNFVNIAAADFIRIATGADDFVQSTFDKLAAALAGIGTGSITTRAQVDAALA
ncbi:DUF4376 domain-containing protein [Bradyrhizobium sp. SZCCHNR2023]|uniref:DUF4376 domain-containing protein n=1 Tax=Bradyrhizobium sp. SZCCHNR2023 TaxID=3057380 RepID=UPI002916DF0D|nr:DUF4376 domain-containing protein [Bradyrhizobium sp. SZCCHNR2023]